MGKYVSRPLQATLWGCTGSPSQGAGHARCGVRGVRGARVVGCGAQGPRHWAHPRVGFKRECKARVAGSPVCPQPASFSGHGPFLPFEEGMTYTLEKCSPALPSLPPGGRGRAVLNEPLLAERWAHVERGLWTEPGREESRRLPPQGGSSQGTLSHGQWREVTRGQTQSRGGHCCSVRPFFPSRGGLGRLTRAPAGPHGL